MHPVSSVGAVLLALLLALGAGPAAAVPDFPEPPRAKVASVARDMVMNGIAADVRQFYTKEDVDRVAAFYREEWAELDGKEPGYTETSAMAPWWLITRIEDGYLMNVQFQSADSGGTWGYLSLSKLPDKDAQPDPEDIPPAMKRTRVMSAIKTEDVGQEGRSYLLYNDHSVTSNVDYYRSYYKMRGWGVQADRSLDVGKVHALAFRNRLQEVTIVIMGDHRESQVVFNEVSHELF
jgi:hypothetical protein